MSQASSTPPVTTQGASFVDTSVDHPRLNRTDAESIRVFLRLYDQYSQEVTARARQLTSTGYTTMEAVRPVNLKFCVDPEYLESAIALDLIEGVDSYEELSDTVLRDYLAEKAKESEETVTLETLDTLVGQERRMDMSDKNARSRMESLFVSYHSLLRRNGISWLLKSNQKVAVSHVMSAVRPVSLKERLKSDLDFAHHELKKDFKGFMRHAVKLSDAFQLVDSGPKNKKRSEHRDGNNKQHRSGNSTDKTPSGTGRATKSSNSGSQRPLPDCPFGPCKSKGKKRLIKDCPASTKEEKDKMFSDLAAQRASGGPARSTRSKQGDNTSKTTDTERSQSKGGGLTGRISPKKENHTEADYSSHAHPSCSVTVSDGQTSLDGTGRCDDGSDDSIVSSKLAERAVIRGIGKITAITPIRLSVALKSDTEAQKFSFSRKWTSPRTVLHLSSGELALANVSFLIADDDLACEDLLIGLPVLQHLQVDTRTLLEQNRSELDGADCSSVGNPTAVHRGGAISRMMIARLNRIREMDDTSENGKREPAHNRPRVNYYTARNEEDPFPDQSLLDPVDLDQEHAIRNGVEGMKKSATENGLLGEHQQELADLLDTHVNIFRTGFSAGRPAEIKPLKIELTPDARPVKVRLRNYSREQREFLEGFVDQLLRNGLAYANPTSPWACAPLLVPKPGPARFRFTVDLRPVNKFTVKHQYPMPNLEHELTKLSDSRYFASFDLSHGYWQLQLDKGSQELQSFITPDGIYTPTRVLHGTTNAVTHLQSSLAEVLPKRLCKTVLHWLDDILLHHKTIAGLLEAIRIFLELCAQLNLKLHPAKCMLFSKSVRWCGRLISADGIRYDPARLNGLLRMESPTTGAHLQQFLCALQWLRNGIPQFAELVQPLHDAMERIYNRVGKRMKRAVARTQLSLTGWSATEETAFGACKTALAHQVTLAHRDDSKRLCVYTDASDTVWSGIMTQVPREDLAKSHAEQRHEPFAFLSGRFNRTQFGWSTLEKEAYAVLASLERMHWLAATPDGFDLYTDQNNLIFLFDPLSVVPDLSATTLRKVLRWAVRLSMYCYMCFHIKGVDNVWAELLGRWSAPRTIHRLVHIPELPSSSASDFEWPSSQLFADAQAACHEERPAHLSLTDGLWRHRNGAIWIPDSATDLQLRACIIAHIGPSGHRGRKSNAKVLRGHGQFYWPTLHADVRSFVRACIHCLSTVGGGKIPRLFGPSVFGTAPNRLVQFDYIEVGPSRDGAKYIRMLRDDHSAYAWFFTTADTAAETAAISLIDWSAAFGVPSGWMSDGPTHFKNEVLRSVSKGLKVPHHFTLPYSPWSNGAVERLGKELLRVFRSVVSELQMRFEEWPDILPLVQSALNNVPSPSRKEVAPITAFTSMAPTLPISTFLRTETTTPVTVDKVSLERAINVAELKNRIAELHPVIENTVRIARQRKRAAVSREELPKFTEGDFVLVAREDFFKGEKLALRWRGPRRIINAISDWVFQVEDLRNGVLEDVHACRLKFYHDASLDTDVIMSHVLSSEMGMPVARLMRLVDTPNGMKVFVRWKGLPHSEDSLEPLERVYEDVPAMLLRLLQRKNTPNGLVEKARSLLAL